MFENRNNQAVVEISNDTNRIRNPLYASEWRGSSVQVNNGNAPIISGADSVVGKTTEMPKQRRKKTVVNVVRRFDVQLNNK